MIAAAVVGGVLVLGAIYIASDIKEVADGIYNYYQGLARAHRWGPKFMSWSLRPSRPQALAMAWLLDALGFGMGVWFIVAALR